MPYSNQIITLDFPELTDDPAGDPIRVVIRNPRLMASGELTIKDSGITAGPDGQPVVTDEDAAEKKGFERFAKLVVGWRVYDATWPIELDAEFNVVSSTAPLLPLPATADSIARLPLAILTRLGQELTDALNPK